MSKIPGLTGAKLIKALQNIGFEDVRTKGSHHFLKHPDGRVTTVPVHRGETISYTLNINDLGLFEPAAWLVVDDQDCTDLRECLLAF